MANITKSSSTAAPSIVPSCNRDSSVMDSIQEQMEKVPWEPLAAHPPQNADIEAVESRKRKPTSFYLSVLALAIMSLIVAMDATSLAVAIPAVTSQLGGTTLEAFWASISFMLAVVVTQPIYTSISDVFGRKIPLYASILLFTVGSIVFALAQSMTIVIWGRVLQGLGGGGLDVLQEIILADITSLKERPMYLGLLAIPMALGSILGPITGALFSQLASWRWIGWVNVPVIAVGCVLALFFMNLRPIDDSFREKVRKLDWAGMLFFGIGATSVALPLSWAGAMYPWSSWRTVVPLVIGVAILIAFGWYERRPSQPVFPYRMLANRTAAVTLLGAFLHGIIMYTLLLYLPLFFQAVFLEKPLQSALSLLPASMCVVAFSGISAGAVEFTRRYRWVIWIGWLFSTVGIALWTLFDRDSARWEIVILQIVAGVGIGSVFTTLTIPIQASVKNADDAGLAVGILVAFRLFGALLGLSIGSTVFSSVFHNTIAALKPLPPPLAKLENASEAVGFIPYLVQLDLPADTMGSLIAAYRQPFQSIWIIMACVAMIGFLTSFFTRELTLEKEQLGRQRLESNS